MKKKKKEILAVIPFCTSMSGATMYQFNDGNNHVIFQWILNYHEKIYNH